MTAATPQAISTAIVHGLKKASGERAATTDLRATCLAVTPALQRLVDAVHGDYVTRLGKSYGAFEADAELFPAQTHIRKLLADGTPDFVAITHGLMRILADSASGESFATGGYVLMADVGTGAARWLYVAILTDVAGAAIDANLDVIESTHLDVSALRFAGRINLTELAAGGERYISFLRGRKSEVSAYFQEFLGCSTVMKPLVETQRLVQAIKQFAIDNELDEPTKERLLKETFDFAQECIKEKRDLYLDALANRVWPDEPAVLKTALGKADPPISDAFMPHGTALRPLRKFVARTANWSLEFEREAFIDHTITFNPADKTITIHTLPDDILSRLNEEFRNDDGDTPDEATA